jgi:hypothetical protein
VFVLVNNVRSKNQKEGEINKGETRFCVVEEGEKLQYKDKGINV